jgi:hypothetical protein
MTKYVNDSHRCEHYALSVGRRCKQRGWLLVSRGNGEPKWSCGSHAQLIRRDYGDEAVSVAVRDGEGGLWWQGPVLPWPTRRKVQA